MTGTVLWREGWPIEPSPLRPDTALVWIGRLSEAEKHIRAIALTAADLRDGERHPAPSRDGFLARRRLLRRVVAGALGRPPTDVVVAYDAIGHPHVDPLDGPLFVSTAHRLDRIGVAVARRPVGLDIEVIDVAAEIPTAVLAPAERRALDALDLAARWPAFLALWTAKEAYLKALGLGLEPELAEIAVTPSAEGIGIVDRGRAVALAAADSRLFASPVGDVRATCIVLG